MNILTVLLMLTSFSLTRVSHMKTAVQLLVAQSLMVAAVCVVVAAETASLHGYLVAGLTLVVKAGLIPFSLLRMLKASRHEREIHPILSYNLSSLAAGLCLVLAHSIVGQAKIGADNGEALASAIALTLLGLMLIMTRRQALMQVVGLLTMENGLYLVGLSITHGLPLIIELGIFFDVLVVAVVLSILIRRLRLKGLSTDTSQLQELKG
ncbi:hydrogenase [Azotosporobacter soli]|uniref:hydrogenase n=1 Tax=Azotosporobacter soli TaxID=3055040 RepID=UPI0031FF1355